MTIYFDNCLGACSNATMEISGESSFGQIIDSCRERWGEGTLIRIRNEYVWQKITDRDGQDWKGCCAEKIRKEAEHGTDKR